MFNKSRKLMLIGISSGLLCMVLGFSVSYFSSPSTTKSDANNMGVYSGLTENIKNTGEAKLVITAPTEVRIGKLVVLDVSKSSGNTFKWLVVPETEDFLVIDNGRRAVFSSGVVGEYMFIIACAINDSVDVQRHIVRVVNTGPTPPGPVTPDDPMPPVSPTSTLSKKVSEWCASIQSPTRAADAVKLANAFDSVAARIDAGTLTDPYAIITATAEVSRSALGPNAKDWVPFLRSLQAELEQRASDGTLSTPTQHAGVWKEIAKGLRYFATR
jgi:hypothetical protein